MTHPSVFDTYLYWTTVGFGDVIVLIVALALMLR